MRLIIALSFAALVVVALLIAVAAVRAMVFGKRKS